MRAEGTGDKMKVEDFLPDDLDVQKAVVESLAADKAEQDEKLNTLIRENAKLKSEVTKRDETIAELRKALENVGDVLAKNAEPEGSSKIALLDRDQELNDRFSGETRDHVLEVIREAREAAEKDGRIRRAQILESVLLANEPVGTLAKKRIELQKLFSENANILSGQVIEELAKRGISHKKGEEYLLPSEIIKRVY